MPHVFLNNQKCFEQGGTFFWPALFQKIKIIDKKHETKSFSFGINKAPFHPSTVEGV